MIAAVVLNAAGLAALAARAGQPFVTAGAAGFGIASVFWLILSTGGNFTNCGASPAQPRSNVGTVADWLPRRWSRRGSRKRGGSSTRK